MVIRRWLVTALAAVAMVACGSPSIQTVARVGDVTLTRPELEDRIERIQAGIKKQMDAQPAGGQTPPAPSDVEIEQQLVEMFVRQSLLLNAAQTKGISVSDAEIDGQIDQFRTNFEQSGSQLDQVVQDQLGYADAAAPEFRLFVSSIVAQDKLGQTLVTTDTVEAEVSEQVRTQATEQVEEARVAHILVETEEDATAVLERLEEGEKFEDLAKEVSQDPGSAQNGGEMDWARDGSFVEEFNKAVFEDMEVGETSSAPVQTQFGFHIIRLLDRREGPAIPEDQVPMIIEQQVQQEVQQRRQQAVEQLLDEERKRITEDGQLEEPTYPTATPAPTLSPDQLEPGVVPGEGEAPPAEGEPAPAETPVATPGS